MLSPVVKLFNEGKYSSVRRVRASSLICPLSSDFCQAHFCLLRGGGNFAEGEEGGISIAIPHCAQCTTLKYYHSHFLSRGTEKKGSRKPWVVIMVHSFGLIGH